MQLFTCLRSSKSRARVGISLALLLGVTVSRANAQNENTRVSALEERVRTLEAEVQQLIAMQQAAHGSQNTASTTGGTEAFLLQASVDTLRNDPVRNQPEMQNAHDPAPPEDTALQATATPVERYRGIPQELLPNLGRIGATAFFDSGANQSPFSLGLGSFVGGGLDFATGTVTRGTAEL